MSDTDAPFANIAKRIGRTEDEVRSWVHQLIEGRGDKVTMDMASRFLIAMGAGLVFSVRPAEWLNEEPEAEAIVVPA